MVSHSFDLRLPSGKEGTHLFMCLLAVFSVEKCLLRSTALLLTGFFVFLLLSCNSPFRILEIGLF